jgi:hypothetical protein
MKCPVCKCINEAHSQYITTDGKDVCSVVCLEFHEKHNTKLKESLDIDPSKLLLG